MLKMRVALKAETSLMVSFRERQLGEVASHMLIKIATTKPWDYNNSPEIMISSGLVWREKSMRCPHYLKLLLLHSVPWQPLSICPDGASTAQEPLWLADVPAAVEFIAAAEVAVVGFFQVCASNPLALPPGARCALPWESHFHGLLARWHCVRSKEPLSLSTKTS